MSILELTRASLLFPQLYSRIYRTKCSPAPFCVITVIHEQNVGATFWQTQVLASKISWEVVLAETAENVVAGLVSIPAAVILFPGRAYTVWMTPYKNAKFGTWMGRFFKILNGYQKSKAKRHHIQEYLPVLHVSIPLHVAACRGCNFTCMPIVTPTFYLRIGLTSTST